jgi:predicted HAD superfamily Cof-like phosphohydrolase
VIIDYVGMLRNFHSKFGHYTGISPHIPDAKTLLLRSRLINEEVNRELLPVLVKCDIEGSNPKTTSTRRLELLTEVSDAIADSLYVIFGTALAFGIPMDEIFAEVQRSNMSKSDIKDKYGKTIKGLSFSKPDLEAILKRHMEG